MGTIRQEAEAPWSNGQKADKKNSIDSKKQRKRVSTKHRRDMASYDVSTAYEIHSYVVKGALANKRHFQRGAK